MTLRTAQQAAQILIAAGHSQDAIGKRAGVSQATISRILSGNFKDPAGSTLIKLNEFADEAESKAAAQAEGDRTATESQPQH